jgi:hypothetical protein
MRIGKRGRDEAIEDILAITKRRAIQGSDDPLFKEIPQQASDPQFIPEYIDRTLQEQPNIGLYDFTLKLGELINYYITLRINKMFQPKYKHEMLKRIEQVGGRDLHAFFHAVGVELRTLADMKGTNNRA